MMLSIGVSLVAIYLHVGVKIIGVVWRTSHHGKRKAFISIADFCCNSQDPPGWSKIVLISVLIWCVIDYFAFFLKNS